MSLLEHLSGLEQNRLIDVWTEERLRPGTDLRREIAAALGTADIALLLVSAPFLASELAQNSAYHTLLREQGEHRPLLIPVLVRHCAWKEHPLLRGIVPLPKSGTPLANLTGPRRDEALVEVCREIAALVASRPTQPASTARVPGFQTTTAPAPPVLSQEVSDGWEGPGFPWSEPLDPPPTPSMSGEMLASLPPRMIISPAQIQLAVLQSDHKPEIGQTFVLTRSPTTIGRGPADIELRDSCVSRKHVILELSDFRAVLRDAGSTHGTSCNGMIIGGKSLPPSAKREVVLSNGDIIQLGPTAKLCVTILSETQHTT